MDIEEKELVNVALHPKENEFDQNSGEENETSRHRCERYIDMRMLPLKIAYTMYFGGLGAWLSYAVIFLISVGLTPFESGLVSSMRTLVSSFTIPFWGFLADYTGRRNLILLVVSVGVVLTVLPAPFIAAHLRNDSNDAPLTNITRDMNLTIAANVTVDHGNTSTTPIPSPYCTSKCNDRRMFHGMLAQFLVIGLFEFGVTMFLDSSAMVIIENNKRKTSYGKQRVFGAVGFAFGSFIAGIASDSFKHKYLVNYAAIFFVYLPFSLFGIPFYNIVIRQAGRYFKLKADERKEEKKEAKDLMKEVVRTCTKLQNLMFLVTVFVQGTTMSFKYGFMFVHMKDNMNASATAMGLSVATANISEVVMFPFSHFLIKRFGGIQCLMFTVFVNAVRFIMLAYAKNPWVTLPIETLHSFGFALSYAAIVEIVYKISATEIVGTMFGIANALNFTLASMVGSVLGGYLYGTFGGKMFFIINGVITGAWAVIGSLFYWVSSRMSA